MDSAGRGDEPARVEFVKIYQPVVRAYLAERWRDSKCAQDVDDAAQEIFFECFRSNGALDPTHTGEGRDFRAYLFGIARNVARRFEERAGRAGEVRGDSVDLGAVEGREERVSLVVDRAWARSIVREGAARQEACAQLAGAAAVRRVEILRLRFHEGLPIRAIAERWGLDTEFVHREYAKARVEFHSALVDVLLAHQPGSRARAAEECERLLSLLG